MWWNGHLAVVVVVVDVVVVIAVAVFFRLLCRSACVYGSDLFLGGTLVANF